MKILFIGCLARTKNGNSYGGAEKSIINIANWFARNGHEVILASVEGSERAFPIDDSIKFIGSRQFKKRILSHTSILLNTWRAILQVKPDVVISFWIHPLFYGLPLLKLLNIKFFYSLRNDPQKNYSKISKWMLDKVLNNCSGAVFQTHDAMRYFDEYISAKSEVIYNPTYIRYNDYPIPTNRRNVIVNVGRLNPQKNQRLLIEAFAVIANKYPDLGLEIYGEGPLRKELDELIIDRGLSKRIRMMGTTSHILDKVYGARLFVMTSDYEGMPNALIEAMCLGTPVLSSDCPCGGPRELFSCVKATDCCQLFKTGDLDMLVEKMDAMLSIKFNIESIEAEKKICNKLSEDEIFASWENFICR